MYGIIYKITNKNNGKVYIGQATGKLSKRWSQHSCLLSPGCPILKKAIQKYGKESFVLTVICKANSKEELNHREKLCIGLFNTITPSGYNLSSGGESKNTHPNSIKKMSKALKGQKRSKETILRMRLAQSIRKGRKLSQFTKDKMSAAKKGVARPEWVKLKISHSTKGKNSHVFGKTGKNHPRSQSIRCLNDNLLYESMSAAAAFYKMNAGLITQQIQGKISFAKGLRFKKEQNGKNEQKT